MKKIKLKFIFILLISLITLMPVNNIKAITLKEENGRKVVKGLYKQGNYSASLPHLHDDLGGDSSGVISTHAMSITIEGEKEPIPAYCAWYENDSPLSNTEPATYIALTDKELPQRHAVGLASIIYSNEFDAMCSAVYDNKYYNKKSYKNYYAWNNSSHKLNGRDCVRVMKTMAINLYLSVNDVMAGKTCANGSERFDGIIEDYKELKILYNKGIQDSEGIYNEYKNIKSNDFWKKIAEVVDDAETAKEEYRNNPAKLTINDAYSDKNFQENSGEYIKKFYLDSNYPINSVSVSIKTTNSEKKCGIDNSCHITKISNNQYVVKIEKSTYENAIKDENFKVIFKAKVNKNKIYIFTSENQNRCAFQDLIFALPEPELIEVSTNDKPDSRICWKYKKSCNTTACTNEKNNTRTCTSNTEQYLAEDCAKNDKNNNEYGTLTYRYSGCNLYCKEQATVSYPGNLLDPVSLNKKTNFVWPTPPANGSDYPLSTIGKLECHVVPNNDSTTLQTCINKIKKNNKKFVYQNAATGTVTYDDLVKDVSVKVKGNCSTTQTDIDSTGKITLENKCTYSLDNEYNYNALKLNENIVEATKVEKENYIKGNNGKIILSTQPFLPLVNDREQLKRLNNLLLGKYELQVSTLSLGNKGQFTELLEKNPYVCHYKVTDTIDICTGGCVCPPGTKHAGKKLSSVLIKESLTCSDAIEEHCGKCEYDSCTCYDKDTGLAVDSKMFETCLKNFDFAACALDNNCIQYNLVCPEIFEGKKTDFKGKSLECCLDLGYSYADCVDLECYAVCPSNSDSPGKDIKGCIKTKKETEKIDEYEAYYLCVAEECYGPCPPGKCPPSSDDPGSGKIIYRTISLENPFVGKTNLISEKLKKLYADRRYNKLSDFNKYGKDLAIYRFPGSNWYSPKTVYNKIWNNRGYKASKIYNEAKPLYTINLDPTSIKEIREYNEKNKYDDFKLTCTSGAYCISEFVHDTLKNMKNADNSSVLSETESTCYNVTQKSEFESCYTTKKVGNK